MTSIRSAPLSARCLIGMSKRVTSTGYVVAWLVAVIVAIAYLKSGIVYATAAGDPTMVWLAAGIASLVMVVMWIGALIGLGRQHAWGWFVAVLVLQLVGLGIVGMVAYALAGPERVVLSVIRPSFT
jgi:hypothetical protein